MRTKLLVSAIIAVGTGAFLLFWISATHVQASENFPGAIVENGFVSSTQTSGALYLLVKGSGNARKGGGARGGNSPGFPDVDVGDWDYSLPDYTAGFEDSSSNSGRDSKAKSEDDRASR